MIELKGVTKQYLYGARVLGTTEMCVEDGKIVALLGDEGSGKTTLLKVIASVTDYDGKVLIDGNNIAKRPDDVLMIFDDLAVFENRSFYYNLAYPLSIRGYAKDEIDRKVKACAERMGIMACLYEKVRKMPLIDVKRLAIARLFLREYRVLLIDDITNGLSRDEADELWDELSPIVLKIAQTGVSVIYSTKSVKEALSISDKIAVLHYGELKQFDTVHEIVKNPANIWAAQALDKYYHFERSRLEKDDTGYTLVLGVDDVPPERRKEYRLDGSVFDGKLAMGFENKDLYAGWHACDFADEGERTEGVEYAVYEDGGYVLHTKSGICIRSVVKKSSVCTLPKIEKVVLYDYTNENSVLKN